MPVDLRSNDAGDGPLLKVYIMASISKDATGNRTIQFMGSDGKRRSIRLGKMNSKMAESLKLKVETLAASVASKIPLDSETAAWLGNIGDDLAEKLAGVGLMPQRQSRNLGEFLDAYLERRKAILVASRRILSGSVDSSHVDKCTRQESNLQPSVP